jgi:hypothetical protein
MTDFISAPLLNKLAYIYAPLHAGANLQGGVTDETPVYTTGDPPTVTYKPCRLDPQMSGTTGSLIGSVPTGKFAFLFQADITIKQDYILVIDGNRFKVESALQFPTHVEGVAVKLPARTK